MVEILQRSMAQGIWIYKSFACFFFSFLGHWKGKKVTTMHNVHNATHLLMNKVTQS
jgi:hypothetical protein